MPRLIAVGRPLILFCPPYHWMMDVQLSRAFAPGMPSGTLRCLMNRDGSIYRRESVSGALCGDWSRLNVSWLETEWSAFVVMEHLIDDSISTWHLQDPSRSLFDCIVAPFWMNLQCSLRTGVSPLRSSSRLRQRVLLSRDLSCRDVHAPTKENGRIRKSDNNAIKGRELNT